MGVCGLVSTFSSLLQLLAIAMAEITVFEWSKAVVPRSLLDCPPISTYIIPRHHHNPPQWRFHTCAPTGGNAKPKSIVNAEQPCWPPPGTGQLWILSDSPMTTVARLWRGSVRAEGVLLRGKSMTNRGRDRFLFPLAPRRIPHKAALTLSTIKLLSFESITFGHLLALDTSSRANVRQRDDSFSITCWSLVRSFHGWLCFDSKACGLNMLASTGGSLGLRLQLEKNKHVNLTASRQRLVFC